ncbi:MAG: carboxymuconolactone decarboxylase family protein [Actinomycetota bacterium]|nr:MAG: carboxymuconolactone decarboxylase family protein [Actinomycetota bacterium]
MRIDYHQYNEIVRPMHALSEAVNSGTLEPALLELVKVRASQINGCAHCLEMHTKDALALGESGDRLNLVAVWREAPMFSGRERAALQWCEELTLISHRQVPDELYEEMLRFFSEDEMWRLTLAITVINSWNRLALAFRAPVGDYISTKTANQAKK